MNLNHRGATVEKAASRETEIALAKATKSQVRASEATGVKVSLSYHKSLYYLNYLLTLIVWVIMRLQYSQKFFLELFFFHPYHNSTQQFSPLVTSQSCIPHILFAGTATSETK